MSSVGGTQGLQSWCISAYIEEGRDHERTGEMPIGPTGAGVMHGSNKWGGEIRRHQRAQLRSLGRGEHGTVAVGGLYLGKPLTENAERGGKCEGGQMGRAEGGRGTRWKGRDAKVEGAPRDGQSIEAPGVTA